MKQLDQLKKFIHAEVKKTLTEGKKKKVKLEGLSVEGSGHVNMDEIGRFFVVTNPTKGSTSESIMFESDVFNFNERVNNGLDINSISAIVKKESAAKRAAGKLLKERLAAVKEAKNQAESLKNLKGEVRNKIDSLKTKKVETEQAVASINERKRNARKSK